MAKFAVYQIATASYCLGIFEAETKAEALEIALEEGEPQPCLCHQCSEEIELGDWYEEQIDELK